MQPQQNVGAPGNPAAGRQIDDSIHADVQKFSQDMFMLKKKIDEYQQLNAKKNAPGATDSVKSNVNLRMRNEVKNVDEMFRMAYAKVAMFEDDLKKYGLTPQNIALFKQNLQQLERIKRAVFAEALGQNQNTLRGVTVKVSRREETEAQRNMTTTQIVDNTDQILNRQNEIIDQIGHVIDETKVAALEMGDQLDKSNTHLTDIGVEMEYTNQNIIARTEQMNKISKMTKKHKTCLMGVINAVLAGVLALVLYFGITGLEDEADNTNNETPTTE